MTLTTDKEQDFGANPLEVRESEHYQEEYVQQFVEKWDELIDWEARADSEGRFFVDMLKGRDKDKILDVATGTGFHSVQLLKAGFDVTSAEVYYDSTEADAFYKTIWGGEDIHIGLYKTDDEPIADASRRTVETMADRISGAGTATRILDLGAGYGGAARYLADRFGCPVTCLNLSETQNDLNRELTAKAGLEDLVRVVHGNFENIPEPDAVYDVVWSQDAILHSGERTRVLDEIRRVLTPAGQLIFTDPMQADDCPEGVLQPILDRIQLSTLASFAFYRDALAARGFHAENIDEQTAQLRTHYARVRTTLQENYDQAVDLSGREYVDNMLSGLQHWVDGADRGYLAWGIMDFRRA